MAIISSFACFASCTADPEQGDTSQNPSLRLPAPDRNATTIPPEGIEPPVADRSDAMTFAAPAPVANAPVIAEWNRTVLPGESFTMTGSGFTLEPETGADCTVWILANGELRQADVWMLEENLLTASLPGDLQPGMVFVWVENSAGASRPVTLNRTDAQWIGPLGNQARPGETKRVMGRNLAQIHEEKLAWVWLVSEGKKVAATALPVVSANPYSVEFSLPEDIENGTYQLWSHNGMGGKRGWSGPLELQIDSWERPAETVEIKAGESNPADAIQAAVDRLHSEFGGGTITLEKGNYLLDKTVLLKPGIALAGAGMESSVISGKPVTLEAPEGANIRISDLTIEAGLEAGQPVHDLWIERVNLRGAPKFAFNGTRIAVIDSVVPVINGLGVDSWYRGNKVIGIGPATSSRNFYHAAVYAGSSRHSILEHNHLRNEWPMDETGAPLYDTVEHEKEADSWYYRVFLAGGRGAKEHFNRCYIAHNLGENIGGAGNIGEMILLHSTTGSWFGSVASNDGLTMRVGNHNLLDPEGNPMQIVLRKMEAGGPVAVPEGSSVVIVHGTGLGQARDIVDFTEDTITVDQAWTVEPDATSRVVVCKLYRDNIIYSNELNAFPPGYPLSYSKSQGVGLFGNSWNTAVEGNTTRRSFNVEIVHARPLSPCFWNEFRNERGEEIFFSGAHIIFGAHQHPEFPGAITLGNMFRHNHYEITGPWIPGRGGPMLRVELNNHNLEYSNPITAHVGNVFEFIEASGGKVGIGANRSSQTLFRKNKLILGDDDNLADIPMRRGVSIEDGAVALLAGNVYENAEEEYQLFDFMHYAIQDTGSRKITEKLAADQSGAPRLVPLHRVARFQAGTPAKTITIPVVNAGTAPANWEVEISDPWIVVEKQNGIIPPEASTDLVVSVDPEKVPNAPAKGNIVLRAGNEDAVIGVRYDPPPSSVARQD